MAMAVVTTPPEADAVDKCLELGDSPDFEPRQLPTAAADGAGVVELATDLLTKLSLWKPSATKSDVFLHIV